MTFGSIFSRSRWWLPGAAGGVSLLVALGILFLGPAPVHAASAPAAGATDAPLCRFGVNVHLGTGISGISDFDVAPLRAGTYIDYRGNSSPVHPNGMRYIPVIRLQQTTNGYTYWPTGAALEEMVLGNAGAPVYIGNEPDRRFYQDDIEPDVYATAYHDLYTLIKSIDPSMQIFPASIVQATELRLRYLDLILAAYREQYGRPMPVDGWSVHGFILNEQAGQWGAEIPPGLDDRAGMVIDVQQTDDLGIFTANIERFRQWMYDNGYRDTPLYLSEYGSLMPNLEYLCGPNGDQCFTEARVNTYMDATFDYLLNATDAELGFPADDHRLVQHFSWYSTNDKGFNGFLFDEDNGKALSSMGQNYADYTAAIEDVVDVQVVKIWTSPVAPPFDGGPVDLTVHAEIANSGNLQAPQAADVTFYRGDPDHGGVPLGSAQAVELAGCGERTRVSYTLEGIDNRANGEQLFVRVAVDGTTDSDTANNTASTIVFFAKAYVYLPMID